MKTKNTVWVFNRLAIIDFTFLILTYCQNILYANVYNLVIGLFINTASQIITMINVRTT